MIVSSIGPGTKDGLVQAEPGIPNSFEKGESCYFPVFSFMCTDFPHPEQNCVPDQQWGRAMVYHKPIKLLSKVQGVNPGSLIVQVCDLDKSISLSLRFFHL